MKLESMIKPATGFGSTPEARELTSVELDMVGGANLPTSGGPIIGVIAQRVILGTIVKSVVDAIKKIIN